MSTIDERVVSMKFDNAQFEQGVKTTTKSLDDLNKGLKLEGATKGLSDVANAAKNFTLQHIADGVDAVKEKFSAMSIIGITALTNIVNRAVDAGISITKSLTIDPVKAGLESYTDTINATQIILANTKSAGTTLKDVTATLAQLQTYANQTVYSFSDMTQNIGRFTAAGVALGPATDAIKGMANAAALSGASTEQMSGAMYQMSQALATGTIKLQDWNSLANANLAGSNIQKALEETARSFGDHGKAMDKAIKKQGSFRDSLTEGWLTADVFTKTMKVMGGTIDQATGEFRAFSVEELKQMGYSDAAAKSLHQLSQDALDSAVKIRTIPQLMAALREEVATAWGSVFKVVFGDINDATTLFTGLHTVAENALTGPVYGLKNLLQGWADLGGRAKLIDALTNAFKFLGAILKPIKDAFREVFPPATAKELYNITVAIDNFTKKLKIGGTTANEIKRTFAGVFAIFDIGWQVIKQVGKIFFDLFGIAAGGSGHILKLTARLGDFLLKIDRAVKSGDGFINFFKKLESYITAPIDKIKQFASYVETLYKKMDFKGGNKSFLDFWSKVGSVLKDVGSKIGDALGKFGDWFSNLDIVQKIKDALSKMRWGDILKTINTGLFAGLSVSVGLLVKKIIDKIKGGGGGEGGGFFSGIKESFEQLTDTLKAMQTTLKVATLLEIAAALAVLTISVVALSKIDSQALTNALTAITIMFTQLFTSMAVFEKYMKDNDFRKMAEAAAVMILLGIAIDIMASAVKKLADLDWNGLSKGLTGLTVMLGAIVATVKLMPDDKKMISSSIGVVLLAAAVKLLANSVTDLSGLSWEEMAKGLTGIAAILGGLALFTKFSELEKGGLSSGIGLLLMANGVDVLAKAMKDFSGLSWEQIAKGVVGLAGSLEFITGALDSIPPTAPLAGAGIYITALALKNVADVLEQMGQLSWSEIGKAMTSMFGSLLMISLALDLIPPYAPLTAAGIYITALALKDVADVLDQMGQMSWEAIGKAMTALAGSLLIIGIAVTGMILALPGAVALVVVAGALAVLQPVLEAFGNMSWDQIGTGIATLALLFTTISIGGILITPAIPALIGLGVAVALLGVGMLAAGAGMLAFATALTLLSELGKVAADNLTYIVTQLIGLIPLAMEKVGEGVIAFANVIATSGPAITGAMVTVLNSLINAVVFLTPKIVNALYNLLLTLLNTMLNYVPKLVDAGSKLIIAFLNGLANNLGGIITAATNVIVAFLNGIAANQSRITDAGVKLIISFINGTADAIRNNTGAMHSAGWNLAMAIIDGMTGGLASGAGRVISKAASIAADAWAAAKRALDSHSPSKKFMQLGKWSNEGFAIGLDKHSGLVTDAATGVGLGAVESLRNSLSGISSVFDEVDTNPTITPVLDLSEVKKGVGQIGGVLTGQSISVDSAYSQASSASADYQNSQGILSDIKATSGDNFNFTQINNSPKALSSADIYRQTKNQLSVAKGALAGNAN